MIVKASDPKEIATACDCTHCGLPVPAGLFEPNRQEQFCCHGCEGAYQLINACGLTSFYKMAETDAEALSFRNRSSKPSRFAEFDSQSFIDKFARVENVEAPNQHQITLAIDGIYCAACIWLIEKLPSMVNGVLEARVSWARGTVKIRWNSDAVALSRVAQTLCQLGYTPHPVRESDRAKRFKFENRKHLARIGVAAALAGNNMIISGALYFGMGSHMTTGMTLMLRVASCFVGLAALMFPGRVFLKSAWNAIRAHTPHMDLPIALALLVGTVVGTVNVVRGIGEIYFDTLAVLIFLLLIGRWLQFRQQARAADSVEMLYRLTPQTTHKLVDGEAIETMVDLVEVGDLLEIKAGDLFPVDGEIETGVTRVDESILTGESVAAAKTVGDPVSAGTTNQNTLVVMRVCATGNDTRLSKIVEAVEQASLDKPQVVQWANKIGGYFVAVVMLLAVSTFAYWWPVDLEVAVERTIALLIVACPCALALATPLALAVAMGRAAKNRIMIKGGDVLQSLQKPGAIWLDKTGTLTQGNLKVDHWDGDLSCLRSVAVAELNSTHPVAAALLEFAKAKIGPSFEASTSAVESTEIPGRGVSGWFEGRFVLIGNKALLDDNSVVPTITQLQAATTMTAEGFSPCWIAIDGKALAIAALADSIRPDAFQAVQSLICRGWDVGILSGDNTDVVKRVARRLNIPMNKAIGEADPEEKLRMVKKSATSGTVVMIGDGVNDSAALAAASVGVAVKNGAEASLAAAPVYFANPGLNPVLELMEISESTAATMRGNLAVSLAYNITFAGLAFAGFINPFVAAILMPVSSLTVVSLSFRAGRRTKTARN